jgi:ribosome-associated heat shock protein Hsp15
MTKPESPRPHADPAGEAARVRFDKWLWAARFYRTRALAAQAIDAGQARLAGERVKPAHAVRVGDRVQVRRQGAVWDVAVTALADRRGSATDAAALYLESEQSIAVRMEERAQRQAAAAAAPVFTGRPTKRNRRKLADFLGEP